MSRAGRLIGSRGVWVFARCGETPFAMAAWEGRAPGPILPGVSGQERSAEKENQPPRRSNARKPRSQKGLFLPAKKGGRRMARKKARRTGKTSRKRVKRARGRAAVRAKRRAR